MKRLYPSTGKACDPIFMTFEITLADQNRETILQADGYELEGPLTTFFMSDGHTQRLSSWSTRLASYKTDQITCIKRVLDSEHSKAVHHIE